MNLKRAIASALMGGMLLTGSVFAQSQTQTQNTNKGVHHKMVKSHPRVNQVHARENNQRRRMNRNLKSGAMTQKQASHLMKERQHMNQQMRKDRAAHNGHITKAEQHKMNHEENKMNRQIKKDRKKDTNN